MESPAEPWERQLAQNHDNPAWDAYTRGKCTCSSLPMQMAPPNALHETLGFNFELDN
jgi:hypothetical protein